MKKISTIIVKLIFIVLVGVSGFLMVGSPINVNIQNVRSAAKKIINKNVNQIGDAKLKATLQLAKDWGIEDGILEQLPQQYHYNLSYTGLYNLSSNYRENEKITAKNLSFPENNQIQQVVSNVALDKINQNLEQNQDSVKQAITIYHYVFFAIILIYILAALLIVFGRNWASLILLVGTLGSFGILQFYAYQIIQPLQAEVARAISLSTSPALWLGLAIGVITSLAWPLALKLKSKH